jgi:hypothetical protein
LIKEFKGWIQMIRAVKMGKDSYLTDSDALFTLCPKDDSAGISIEHSSHKLLKKIIIGVPVSVLTLLALLSSLEI